MSTHAQVFDEAHEKLKARDGEGARALFLKAAQMKGLDLEGMVASAQERMRAGEVVEASETFLEVFDANPTDVDALLGLAKGALFLGQPEDADSYLLGIHALAPGHTEGAVLQALVHESNGDLSQAQEWLGKAVNQDDADYLAHFNHGRVLVQMGQLDDAIDALIKASDLNPENYDVWYTLGMAYTQADLMREAIVSFNQAMALAPDNIDIYATLADVLCAVRDLDTAMDVLNAGLNQCDEHPGLLQKAAAVASQAGLFDVAVEYLEKVVEALPEFHQAWINLALYYIMTEDLEKSEAAAKRAIEIDPEQWEGYYHLGNLYGTVKLYDQAVEEYRKAIEFSPEGEYRADLNLAAIMIEMDDESRNEDAMGLFDKYELTKEAVEILHGITEIAADDDWRPHYNLALAYGKLGEKNDARELLDLILANEPEGSELFDATSALRENLFSTTGDAKLTQAISSMSQMSKRSDAATGEDEDA